MPPCSPEPVRTQQQRRQLSRVEQTACAFYRLLDRRFVEFLRMTCPEKKPKRVSSSHWYAVRRQLCKEGLDLFGIARVKGDHALDQNFPSGKQRTARHRSEQFLRLLPPFFG